MIFLIFVRQHAQRGPKLTINDVRLKRLIQYQKYHFFHHLLFSATKVLCTLNVMFFLQYNRVVFYRDNVYSVLGRYLKVFKDVELNKIGRM